MTTSSFHTGTGRRTRRSSKRSVGRFKVDVGGKLPRAAREKKYRRDEKDPLTNARKLRLRIQLNQLDYDRALILLKKEGHTQQQLAQELAISQPSVSSALKTAAKTPAPREGFSGADPYEVCQRYAAGDLSRKELINELTHWGYRTTEDQSTEFFDDLRFSTPGSFDDVLRALDDGLIEDDVYDAVLDALDES